MTVKTQEIRGIRVACDEAVSPVRLGFAVVGKTPVQQSYPSLPQCFPPANKPGWRHLRSDDVAAERVASRAGRSESNTGNSVMRSLAMTARLAVQLGRPTAEGSDRDADAVAQKPRSAHPARTSPLNSNRMPSLTANRAKCAKLAAKLGRDSKSARAQHTGLGAPSATSRGRSVDGFGSSCIAMTAIAKGARIPPRAAD